MSVLLTPLVILGLLVLSGVADSLGFSYASRIWQSDGLSWSDLLKSTLGWAVGISLYVVSLRPMTAAGVTSAEVQTAIWFAVTIIGVMVFSGRFFRWQVPEQVVGVLVVLALGWLTVRTGG